MLGNSVQWPRRKLPRRFAPFVYGVIQAAITTAVATGIATYQLTDLGLIFVERWALSWFVAWVGMLPIVILISPAIQRAVLALTDKGGASEHKP